MEHTVRHSLWVADVSKVEMHGDDVVVGFGETDDAGSCRGSVLAAAVVAAECGCIEWP